MLSRIVAYATTLPAPRRVRDPVGTFAIAFESAGLRLRGWVNDVPRARGTVVLAHGYRDDRTQLALLVEPLARRGLRTLGFDFRAHGESEGDRVTIGVEESLDVIAALGFARRTFGEPVSYMGFSMGAAAYLLSLDRDGGGEAHVAVLDSPYDTLHEAIAARFDRFFVPRRFARGLERLAARRTGVAIERVRPIDALARLSRPTHLVFARRDAWIGEETRARFRAAAPPGCTFELVEGGHQDHLTPRWAETIADAFGRALSAVGE